MSSPAYAFSEVTTKEGRQAEPVPVSFSWQQTAFPEITSVAPEPVVGSNDFQWIRLHGRGFEDGFTVRLQSGEIDAHLTDSSRLEFTGSGEVRFSARLGSEAAEWSVQVVDPNERVSNWLKFQVVAPVPDIRSMSDFRKTEGEPGFSLRVFGDLVTSYSTILWEGSERPTTPILTSDDPNALTLGLEAQISAADIAEAGRKEIRVYTPPPGGGMSAPAYLFTVERRLHQKLWFQFLVLGISVLFVAGLYQFRISYLRNRNLKQQVDERTKSLLAEQARTRAQNEQLTLQARRISELDRAKSRFFANISHEFRTPLTMISGPIRDLISGAHGPLTAGAFRQLEIMDRNARHLERLIDELLDLSKLQSGQMKPEPRMGNLVRFVRQIVQSLVPMAERKRISLQVLSHSDDIPFRFDEGHVQKIVSNLVSNAIKFTGENGKVMVAVEDAAEAVTLSVEDTGTGIPENVLPRVFDRFYQVERSAERKGGVGLGLSLAREFAQVNGGDIRVESRLGFGSKFTVTLPRQEATDGRPQIGDVRPGTEDRKSETGAQRQGAEDWRWGTGDPGPEIPEGGQEAAVPEAEGDVLPHTHFRRRASGHDAPATVLVVEDNADVRDYIRSHLASLYTVHVASNAEDALKIIHSNRPDLVICDVMMPGMDGSELCRRLKADEAYSDIPVILLTARAGSRGRAAGLVSGADDYISKPFDMKELEARVQNLIESRRALRRRFSKEVLVQPSGIAIKAADEVFLEKAIAVVEEYMSRNDFHVETLAEELLISRGHLNRKLRTLTGMSAAEFVRHLRLKRAAQLLEQKADTVSRIAYAVGFSDTDHFSELFKKYFGVSPSEYRTKG